jgi:hypothetical protein
MNLDILAAKHKALKEVLMICLPRFDIVSVNTKTEHIIRGFGYNDIESSQGFTITLTSSYVNYSKMHGFSEVYKTTFLSWCAYAYNGVKVFCDNCDNNLEYMIIKLYHVSETEEDFMHCLNVIKLFDNASSKDDKPYINVTYILDKLIELRDGTNSSTEPDTRYVTPVLNLMRYLQKNANDNAERRFDLND